MKFLDETTIKYTETGGTYSAPNDVTVTTGGGNNSRAIPEAF